MFGGMENNKEIFLTSLSRGSNTLEDACFPHGVELFDRVVLLVEVGVGSFPGFCHCVLKETQQVHFYQTTTGKHHCKKDKASHCGIKNEDFQTSVSR